MRLMLTPNRRATAASLLATCVALGPISPGNAQKAQPPATGSPADAWRYADIADLVAGAPIVLTARVVDAIAVPESSERPPRPGTIRYYLVGDLVALIRGPVGGVAPRVAWLADLPLDARGKPPKPKKSQVIVAALPVAGRPAELRLAARDATVPWSAALEARMRGVVAAVIAPDAPPQVTGVSSAFHVAGTLPGESETQIFVATTTARPVSISILSRPGLAKTWSVALGEIVDEAAAPPRRDTLGWYRLACFLPRSLSSAAVGELSQEDAAAARSDYAFVLNQLGPCTRMRS